MANPYRGGTADVWYSGTADDLWVEYKYMPKVPVTVPIVVSKLLSPLQLQWLRGRHKEGRNVVVILCTPEGAWWYENLTWEEPLSPSALRTAQLTKRDVADYIRSRVMISCS